MKRKINWTPDLVRKSITFCIDQPTCKGCPSYSEELKSEEEWPCGGLDFRSMRISNKTGKRTAASIKQCIKDNIEVLCDGLYVDLLKAKELTDGECKKTNKKGS